MSFEANHDGQRLDFMLAVSQRGTEAYVRVQVIVVDMERA